jgi:AcrR family transcriptional regulator
MDRTYLPRDERRAQLLAVGLRLFSTTPYESVAIDDIAREAGISKGLLYHYFGGKRELYVGVIEYAAAELLTAIVPDPTRPGVENARRGLEAYLRFVSARADAYLALIGADKEVQAVLESTRQIFATQVLVAAGMDPAVPALRVAARAWLGAVEAASIDWLKHRDVEEADLVDLLSASLYVHLVAGARKAPPGTVKGDLLAGLPLLAGLTR